MFPGYNKVFWDKPIKHRHLVIFFLGLATILLSISIIGCSSSTGANPDIHLVEIKYDAYREWFMKEGDYGIVNPDAYNVLNAYDIDSDLQVRVGYFGICTNSSYSIPIVVRNQLGANTPSPSNATNKGWVCSNNVTRLAQEFTWPTQDALNLIYVADAARSHALTPWVLIVAIVFSGISFFLLIIVDHTQSLAFPLTTGCTSLAFLLAILGMTSQQTGINAISQMAFTLSQHSIRATSGKPAAGLGWSATVFLFLSALALVLIFVNEKGIRSRDSDIEEKSIRDEMLKMPSPPSPKHQIHHESMEEHREQPYRRDERIYEETMEDKIRAAQERAAAEQKAEEDAVAIDTERREAAAREAAAREAVARIEKANSQKSLRRTPSPSAESRHFRMPGTISMPNPY